MKKGLAEVRKQAAFVQQHFLLSKIDKEIGDVATMKEDADLVENAYLFLARRELQRASDPRTSRAGHARAGGGDARRRAE